MKHHISGEWQNTKSCPDPTSPNPRVKIRISMARCDEKAWRTTVRTPIQLAKRKGETDYIHNSPGWRNMTSYSMLHGVNSAQRKDKIRRERKNPHQTRGRNGDIDGRHDWANVLLTNVRPLFYYQLRRKDELETDGRLEFGHKYIYHSQCTASLTVHFINRILTPVTVLLMLMKECRQVYKATRA